MFVNAKQSGGNVRPAAVAGRFYPGHPLDLRQLISALLANCPAASTPPPKAIVAPHAGYIYSGPVAASAYALWRNPADSTHRVVLLGPSHFHAFDGLAASGAEAFSTPLGLVPVDTEGARLACTLPQVRVLDAVHEMEHSLEVQLPFLQVVLKNFTVVPLLAGNARAEEVAQVLELFWGDPETRFVISSDLSHYLDWQDAHQVDERTAKAIEQLDPEAITEEQACGRVPIRGLLRAAAHRGAQARTIDLRNSGDTAGSRLRVVGYGAFAFDEPQSAD